MQRISFDFMTRRIRQMVRESLSKRIQRNKEKNMTVEEYIENRRQTEYERKKYVPETQYGPCDIYSKTIPKFPSRPVRRRIARIEAFRDITKKYSGELRKKRRSMAFIFANRVS